MTAPDLSALCADLKAKAEAATPGPWTATKDRVPGEQPFWIIEHATGTLVWDEQERHLTDATAQFVAAANPAVVLRLVAALEAVMATADRERKNYNDAGIGWGASVHIFRAIDAALAAASPETEGRNNGCGGEHHPDHLDSDGECPYCAALKADNGR